MNQFVIHRLRSKPVEYTVRIKHFVSGGQWMMSVGVEDIAEDDVNRDRVADDLRDAAILIEGSKVERSAT